MITLRRLTKHYGETLVVDDVSCDIVPGRVTGFLGPHGAGKSTTMRMILQLDVPSSGSALVWGRPYSSYSQPLRAIGALLHAHAPHPGRSARNHLVALARSNGIPGHRVDQVLDVVGLTDSAGKRVGTFTLDMSQRLGIAGALLGDPGVLMFDEPLHGLDLDGIRWIRTLLRSLAAEGRTILVAGHLMSEMQLVADHVLVLGGRGRLLADTSIDRLIAQSATGAVHVLLPELAHLEVLQANLGNPGMVVRHGDPHELVIPGACAEQIGDLAYRLELRLHGLREHASLEEAYLGLNQHSLESGTPATDPTRCSLTPGPANPSDPSGPRVRPRTR